MSLQDYEIVFLPLREDLLIRLSAYADSKNIAVEEAFEQIFAGELKPIQRRKPTLAPRTIHVDGSAVIEIGTTTHVFCSCCHGRCRRTFQWRGSARCGCPERPVASGNG